MDFQKRLRELREEAGISQTELGRKLGLSQSQVGNMEIGKRMPSIEVAVQLSEFFHVSLCNIISNSKSGARYIVVGILVILYSLLEMIFSRFGVAHIAMIIFAIVLMATGRKMSQEVQPA